MRYNKRFCVGVNGENSVVGVGRNAEKGTMKPGRVVSCYDLEETSGRYIVGGEEKRLNM